MSSPEDSTPGGSRVEVRGALKRDANAHNLKRQCILKGHVCACVASKALLHVAERLWLQSWGSWTVKPELKMNSQLFFGGFFLLPRLRFLHTNTITLICFKCFLWLKVSEGRRRRHVSWCIFLNSCSRPRAAFARRVLVIHLSFLHRSLKDFFPSLEHTLNWTEPRETWSKDHYQEIQLNL